MAQLIELYEHQRYSFNGWSGDSLLPYVDPYAFTSINTNKSIPEGWNTVIEANVSLLSTGWNWISSDNFWIPNVTSNTDAEGNITLITYFKLSYSINTIYII